MEERHYYPLFFTVAAILLFIRRFFRGSGGAERNLPPSPLAIPIIGHCHLLLRKPLHLNLAALADRLGPVVALRLGSTPALLVSSPEAVEEILTKHDAVFAGHPSTHASRALNFDTTSMFFTPYGAHWRNLRRITVAEVLSPARLAALSGVRRAELLDMVRRMAGGGEAVIRVRVFEMAYNTMSMMVAGRRFFGEEMGKDEAEMGRRFMAINTDLVDIVSSFNPSDFFPAVGWADLMGVGRRVEKLRPRLEGVLNAMLEDRRSKRSTAAAADRKRTLIDVMLDMQDLDPDTYTNDIIKGEMMAILVGGTTTTIDIIDMAMTMLRCHPEVMRELLDEINYANVEAGRLIEESDLPRFSTLTCVLMEVIRMCYFGDFPPHVSSEDCVVQGYYVPSGTIVFLNNWYIHHDPKLWEEPMLFKPERFAGKNVWRDGFKYFPFSAGRRGCPGESLAVRMMLHTVALLVQCFDWDLITKEEANLGALIGTRPRNEKPILAKYTVRHEFVDAISTPDYE